MRFESPNLDAETEPEKRVEKTLPKRRKKSILHKQLGMIGLAALGFLGSPSTGEAASPGSGGFSKPPDKKAATHEQTIVSTQPKAGETFDANDKRYSITYVGKELDYKDEFYDLYTVTDKETGKVREFPSDSIDDAKSIGPEWVKPLDAFAKGIIEQERTLEQSGLTDPDDSYKGPISVDETEKTQLEASIRFTKAVESASSIDELLEVLKNEKTIQWTLPEKNHPNPGIEDVISDIQQARKYLQSYPENKSSFDKQALNLTLRHVARLNGLRGKVVKLLENESKK